MKQIFKWLFRRQPEPLTRDEMIQWCNDHLAAWPNTLKLLHYYPYCIMFDLQDLPTNCGWFWVQCIDNESGRGEFVLYYDDEVYERIYEKDVN